MKHNGILLLLLGMLFLGCQQEMPLEIHAESLTENELAICNDQKCPEITINYLRADGNKAVANRINGHIDKFIIKTLLLDDKAPATTKSIEEAATLFAQRFFEDQSQFPDMAADYFAEISILERYRSATIVSFEMRQYLYTGGAHGYGATSFLNIDPETGKKITIDDLITDIKEFTDLAENQFRQQHNIDKSESLNALGFWFDEETFSLPETVGITKDSLLFIYNQYDIASYADGPIELRISLSDAAPMLNTDIINTSLP